VFVSELVDPLWAEILRLVEEGGQQGDAPELTVTLSSFRSCRQGMHPHDGWNGVIAGATCANSSSTIITTLCGYLEEPSTMDDPVGGNWATAAWWTPSVHALSMLLSRISKRPWRFGWARSHRL